jgi:hypothetical protein
MVTKWGMSEKVGPVWYGDDASSKMSADIDEEVRLLLSHSYERAKNLLASHRNELERLAKALVEHESLTGSEVALAIAGKRIIRPEAPLVPKAKAPTVPAHSSGSGGRKLAPGKQPGFATAAAATSKIEEAKIRKSVEQ